MVRFLNESEDAWRDSLEQFIGRPLKEFLRTVDHRDRIDLEYVDPKENGEHGMSGRVHDVKWSSADDIIVELNRGDGRFYDWVVKTK